MWSSCRYRGKSVVVALFERAPGVVYCEVGVCSCRAGRGHLSLVCVEDYLLEFGLARQLMYWRVYVSVLQNFLALCAAGTTTTAYSTGRSVQWTPCRLLNL